VCGAAAGCACNARSVVTAKINGTLQKPVKPRSKSIDDFRATYDKDFIIPKRIKEALEKIGEGWEFEADLIRLASVCQTDMGTYRDNFAEYFIQTGGKNPKRCWSGSKETIRKMREMLRG
jgi:hypothetical protein